MQGWSRSVFLLRKRQLRSNRLQFGRTRTRVQQERKFRGIETSVEFEYRVRTEANCSSGWFAPRSAQASVGCGTRSRLSGDGCQTRHRQNATR